MKEYLYAQVLDGTEGMFRAISLLRRKSFDVLSIVVKKNLELDFLDFRVVVEKKPGYNPHDPGLLLEKLVGFQAVKKLEKFED